MTEHWHYGKNGEGRSKEGEDEEREQQCQECVLLPPFILPLASDYARNLEHQQLRRKRRSALRKVSTRLSSAGPEEWRPARKREGVKEREDAAFFCTVVSGFMYKRVHPSLYILRTLQ